MSLDFDHILCSDCTPKEQCASCDAEAFLRLLQYVPTDIGEYTKAYKDETEE